MCPRGLLTYAYLLNSLPSCLLLIPCQIAKILGSTSIRHRTHASAPDRSLEIRNQKTFIRWYNIDIDPMYLLSGVLCWPVLSGVSPTAGCLRVHVLCLKWWRPHEVISSSDHYSDVIISVMVSQSTGDGEVPSRRPSNAEQVSIWWRHRSIDTGWWFVIARFFTKEIIWKYLGVRFFMFSKIARSYSFSW